MTANDLVPRRAHVAVIGGGFTGLVSALRLLKAGYRVTVLEERADLGGLTSSADFGPFVWDRFYHCILTSDTALLGLLEELGLAQEVRWTATEVGFFSHGHLYKMTSPADLARFPHLSLFSKARLGLATIYASHLKDGRRLEQMPLAPWTRRIFGRRVFEEIWEPLFRCKLGDMRHQASAAFLWGTLRRLYSTRDKGPGKQEKLGYVHGGYRAVFDRLHQRVRELGAEIHTGEKIHGIRSITANSTSHGQAARPVEVRTATRRAVFDGALLTVPNRAVAALLDTADSAYRQRLGEVRYLGLICMVLVLRRRLSPFYVTNITEQSVFTGVIEMTNLIRPDEETAGYHLVYLPRYTDPGDPLFDASEDEVWAQFAPGLRRIHPDLSDADIAGRFCFRERVVQPVPTLNYSAIVPAPETPVSGVYLANTAQILNNTLNNNVMATLAEAATAALVRDIPATVDPASAPAAPLSRPPSVLEEASCVSV